MGDVSIEMKLLQRHGPRFQLTLSACSDGEWDVSALDDNLDRWITIACGEDLIATLLAACSKLEGAKPGEVWHLRVERDHDRLTT